MPESVVYNEDNMAVMARYPDGFFDVAVIDPEYGIKAGEGIGRSNRLRFQNNKKDWDSKGIPGPEFFAEIMRVSKYHVIWGGNYFIDYLYNTRCIFVWDKVNAGRDFADLEMAWTNFDAVARIIKYRVASNPDERIHPTQKPIWVYECIYDHINKILFKGSDMPTALKILDTGVGSGSNRIAAHRFGHDFIGAELDKDYWLKQENYFRNKILQPDLFGR